MVLPIFTILTDRNGQLSTSGETQKVKATKSFVSLDLGVLF